ncbi:MAG: DUF4157 domain-containing protein [Thermoanaerobaculia bacterium]
MRSKLQSRRTHDPVSRSFAAPRISDHAGRPLDRETRKLVESRFGHDFSQVRIHSGSEAERSAESIGASAFTVGSNIVFGPGAYNRQRLAHELTHVVQQSGGGSGAPSSTAEAEARRNGERVSAGLSGPVQHKVAAGTVQCDGDEKKKKPEKKLENEFSTSSTSTIKRDSIKNKFGFSGEATIPLLPGAKLGPVLFLDNLKLKAEGEKEIEIDPNNPPKQQVPGPADIEHVQTEAAIGLIKLEVPKLEARGFTFGAGIETSGKLSYGTDKGAGAGVGATATIDAGYKSPSLLPKSAGELNLSAGLKATGSADIATDGKGTAKATGKTTLGAAYKSPVLRGPGGTLLGILGDKANLSLGAEGTLTGTAETDNDPATKQKDPTAKLGAGGSVALTGAGKNQQFVKLKVTGEAAIGPNGLDPASKATVVNLSVGFKF